MVFAAFLLVFNDHSMQRLSTLCQSSYLMSFHVFVHFREVKATEVKLKEVQLSVERVPGTLSTASKSVQVNGAATVSNDSDVYLFFVPSQTSQSSQVNLRMNNDAVNKIGSGMSCIDFTHLKPACPS